MGISGSIRKFLVKGISYNVAADANVAKTPRITKEAVPHTGGNMTKIITGTGNMESVTAILLDSEYKALNEIAESQDAVPLSITKADGSTWTTDGHLSLDNYESEENRCDVTLIPESGTWGLFGK